MVKKIAEKVNRLSRVHQRHEKLQAFKGEQVIGSLKQVKRPAWATSPAREEGRPRNPLLPGPGAAQARALSRQLV